MDETTPTFLHASLLRRNRLAALAALLLVAAAPPALVAAALTLGVLPLASLAPLSVLAGILLWTANPAPSERLGTLGAGELGLFFEGRRLSSAASIREGRLLRSPGDAPILRLATRSGPVELRVSDVRAGEEVLRVLGLPAPPPREVRLASRVASDPAASAQIALLAAILPVLFGAVGFTLRAHPVACAALGLVTVAAVLFVLTALTTPTALALGEEGITVGWLGRRRFLRYDEIDGARLWEEPSGILAGGPRRMVSIFLCSGEALSFAAGDAQGDAEALVSRVREVTHAARLPSGYRGSAAELGS